MPIDRADLDWKEFSQKEKVYRKLVLELLYEDPEKAYTFLELCAHVHGKVGKPQVKNDQVFEGNMRAAILDQRIAIVFHNGETYYTLKEEELRKKRRRRPSGSGDQG